MNIRTRTAWRGHPRGERGGAYLIELIIAIATAGMLAAALAANISETHRFSNAGQNQIIAMAIVQEQIDNARNTSYDDLAGCAGNHVLKVNNPDPNYINCPAPSCAGNCRLNPRPLQVDMTNLEWSSLALTTGNQDQNLFRGTVTERVEAGPYLNTIRVTVEAAWQESNSTRRYALSTLVSKNGINNG